MFAVLCCPLMLSGHSIPKDSQDQDHHELFCLTEKFQKPGYFIISMVPKIIKWPSAVRKPNHAGMGEAGGKSLNYSNGNTRGGET